MTRTAATLLLVALVTTVVPLHGLGHSVRTGSGEIAGVAGRNPSIAVFKGIPYAAPPLGPLRWAPPRPPASWQGIRQARTFAPACIQNIVPERKPWTREFMSHDEVSEDCLYLNVWTAARSAGDRRPVFMFIHGGGFTEGSGSIAVYDGEGLAQKGLVVVTINYRLGAFGFLAHPELSGESEHHASGNYGLLDQIAALEWIRDNIAMFGGDPSRVTIAGQSAGAMSVHALVASPLARCLFHRAIAESGGSTLGGTSRSLSEAEQDGQRFAEAKGATSLAALRALTAEQVAASPQTAGPAPRPGVRYAPIVDGYVIPADIDDIVGRGRQNDVPILTGANADEGGASPNPSTTRAAFEAQARRRFADSADAFLAVYPATSDAQAGSAMNESARDQQRMSLQTWAMHRATTSRTKAFTYFWNHALPGPDAERFGAFHTSEVPYALDTLEMSDRPLTDRDRAIAELMSSYWANFAASGDPNGQGLPAWPAVSDAAVTMEIGDRTRAIPVASTPERMLFWQQYFSRPRPPQPPLGLPASR